MKPPSLSLFQAVRALNHYNKPQGAEAVLHNMLMEKRHRAAVAAAAAGGHGQQPNMDTAVAAAAAAAATAASKDSVQKVRYIATRFFAYTYYSKHRIATHKI